MFYLRASSGILEPNEEFVFDVFFEPELETLVERILVIKIENNKEVFHVRLKGEGEMPHLDIDSINLSFTPTLPFSYDSVCKVYVTNPCNFPVEFYFADFDE